MLLVGALSEVGGTLSEAGARKGLFLLTQKLLWVWQLLFDGSLLPVLVGFALHSLVQLPPGRCNRTVRGGEPVDAASYQK